jgi:uncharacterized protein YecE (DUF72 family)
MQVMHIGTAGWNVPRAQSLQSRSSGSHLERYASMMNSTEVNSSFYRPHRRETWQKWSSITPPGFKFAVKAPKAITHMAKLLDCRDLLAQFFEQIAGLGSKLGPVLLQFAPGYRFQPGVVEDFLGTLRGMHIGPVVLEPRNASWFTPEADCMLRRFGVSRVASDPAKGSPVASTPGGDMALRYYRLHGSPRVYWSSYDAAQIASLVAEIRQFDKGTSWVIFDNTAAGEALKNALELKALLGG